MTLSITLNSKILIRSLVFIILSSFLSAQSTAQIKLGDTAPGIRLPDSLGKWTSLSQIKEDFILVHFWAASHTPSVESVQELKKVKTEFENKSFEVFALSLDRDYWNWVNLVRNLDLPFIHVNDAYGLRSPRCKAYNVTNIPKKILIEKGKIIAINPSIERIREILKTK